MILEKNKENKRKFLQDLEHQLCKKRRILQIISENCIWRTAASTWPPVCGEHAAVGFALAPDVHLVRARLTVRHGREPEAEQRRRRLAGARICKKKTDASTSSTCKKQMDHGWVREEERS
jgi:hypothetical protein